MKDGKEGNVLSSFGTNEAINFVLVCRFPDYRENGIVYILTALFFSWSLGVMVTV